MHEKTWYYELKGAAAYWLASLIFILVGAASVAVGVLEEEFFLFIGIPFLCLGIVTLVLLVCSLYVKLKHPENYKVWLWWANFIGGLVGALTFSIPSTLALPALLLMDGDDQLLLIGAVFSVVGLAVTVAIWLLARRQHRGRPRWVSKDKRPSRR
nr:hypothetical protein [Anaerolineae bacterium]